MTHRFSFAFICTFFSIYAMAQTIKVYKNGDTTPIAIYNTTSEDKYQIVIDKEDAIPEHEYVDLGLPSGTLWSSCNLGANAPEDLGDYFAWGETSPQGSNSYSWDSYKWCNGTKTSISKYNTLSNFGRVDRKTELEVSDDAATAYWGAEWCIPTNEQIKELYSSYTTTKWTTVSGKKGLLITSKSNGNTIFLPAAGYKNNSLTKEVNESGQYWSRNLYNKFLNGAYILEARAEGTKLIEKERNVGRTIRPVRMTSKKEAAAIYLILNKFTDTLRIGNTTRITATIVPGNASNKALKWNSSDETIAAVSATGTVTARRAGDAIITCRTSGENGVVANSAIHVEAEELHPYVDLGLPSGTLWATCNVGATQPEEIGHYLAWGETTVQSDGSYSWQSYKWCDDSPQALTRYNNGRTGKVDNKDALEAEDDAATANWGEEWCTPTLTQIKELFNPTYTTSAWTVQEGTPGRMFTSKKNGSCIFLPAAGYSSNNSQSKVGEYGYYMTSMLGTLPNSSYTLYFYSSYTEWKEMPRNNGICVRPVRKKK